MSPDADEAALGWAGETDPSHVAGPVTARVSKKPGTITAVEGPAPVKPTTSSLVLVSYGVLAGIYLIYLLGWWAGVQKHPRQLADLFANVMFQLGEIVAIASPLIWFGAVLLLTRKNRRVVRLLWLLVGLAVLIPWPFLLKGVSL